MPSNRLEFGDIGFASHASSFLDDNGSPISGHGIWPYTTNPRSSHDPEWVSYDTLGGRSDFLAIKVAGLTYRSDVARRTSSGGPGSRLQIVPEPDNPVNAAALAIYCQRKQHHLGYVYDDDLTAVRTAQSCHWSAITAWEWRKLSGERCGMHLLLAPPSIAHALATLCSESPV